MLLPMSESSWRTPSSVAAPATRDQLEFGRALLALLPDDAKLSFTGGSKRRIVVDTNEGLPEEIRAQIADAANRFGFRVVFAPKGNSGRSTDER